MVPRSAISTPIRIAGPELRPVSGRVVSGAGIKVGGEIPVVLGSASVVSVVEVLEGPVVEVVPIVVEVVVLASGTVVVEEPQLEVPTVRNGLELLTVGYHISSPSSTMKVAFGSNLVMFSGRGLISELIQTKIPSRIT